MWLKSKQVGWLELGAMDGVDGWMVGFHISSGRSAKNPWSPVNGLNFFFTDSKSMAK